MVQNGILVWREILNKLKYVKLKDCYLIKNVFINSSTEEKVLFDDFFNILKLKLKMKR